MSIFFTSDTHFFHKGALRFRPKFTDVEGMNLEMVNKWNRKVSSHDTVWFLGDLSFGSVEETIVALSVLNGRKHWIIGNHDKKMIKNDTVCSFFGEIEYMNITKIGTQEMTMCHYPMLVWDKSHYGSWMLHGHSHGNCVYPYPNNKILDVGVDCHNYYPISLDEVADIMRVRSYTASDHHEGELK